MTALLGHTPESTGQWSAAAALSLGIHLLGLAAIVYSLSPFPGQSAQRPSETVITIAPLVTVEGDAPEIGMVSPSDAPLDPAESPLRPAAIPPPAEQGPLAPDAAQADIAQSAAIATAPILAPLTPEAAGGRANQTLTPVLPDASVLSAAPVADTPSLNAGDATSDRIGPASDIARLAPDAQVGQNAVPRAPTTGSGLPSDPDIAELIDRIRGRLGDPCLIALPRPRPAPLEPLVTTLSDQDVTAADFAADVLSDPDLPIEEQRLLIDRRQCPALTFLRGRADYPAFRLQLGLAETDLASGDTLVGRIDGAAGAYTTLLLVDDNGVMQDLRRFLRFTGGVAEFAVPVTRNGPGRETAQLLIALATPDRPATVTALAGRLASDVFPPLAGEIGPRARIAVQAIDVR